VHSSTLKIALALLLSIAMHSVLFLLGEPPEPYLSEPAIIHARLDTRDRERMQQQQTGQITEQHNQQISEASIPSRAAEDQPIRQDPVQAKEKSQDQEVISSLANSDIKTPPKKRVEKAAVVATQAKTQYASQVNNDSRAQVEAFTVSEDPTYTAYRRVLKQYLGQRLEAKAAYKGTVRLKIKIEYGSIATRINVIQSSGNLEIDRWAKRAALAANPYPQIPKEIGSTFEFSPTLQLGTTESTP
jgi:TonB family protein